jgi:hypothetical protein
MAPTYCRLPGHGAVPGAVHARNQQPAVQPPSALWVTCAAAAGPGGARASFTPGIFLLGVHGSRRGRRRLHGQPRAVAVVERRPRALLAPRPRPASSLHGSRHGRRRGFLPLAADLVAWRCPVLAARALPHLCDDLRRELPLLASPQRPAGLWRSRGQRLPHALELCRRLLGGSCAATGARSLDSRAHHWWGAVSHVCHRGAALPRLGTLAVGHPRTPGRLRALRAGGLGGDWRRPGRPDGHSPLRPHGGRGVGRLSPPRFQHAAYRPP